MDWVRALTFDLDDTLWDSGPILMAAEQTLYEWLADHYPRITQRYSVQALREMRLDLVRREPALGHRMTQLRKTSLKLAAESVGYDHSLVDPAFEVFLEARHRVDFYEDVEPVLKSFKQAGYRIGSITNGNADIQRLNLGYLFDFALDAESSGKGKPHPLMFEMACQYADVTPNQLAHIGDDPHTDIHGGNQAGVTVVWMNRQALPGKPGLSMQAEVRGMYELLNLFGLSDINN